MVTTCMRVGVVALAATAAVALGAPAMSSAEPLIAPNSMTLPPIPFDSELAAAVQMLKDAGADRMALEAAQAVAGSVGQVKPQDIIDRVTQLLATQQATAAAPLDSPLTSGIQSGDAMSLLKQLGIQPFTPSVAPFCAAPTADNPLGLVTAGAGAVPGPWPLASEPVLPFPIPFITLPKKLNLVDKGETAFAFVPPAPSGDGGTMRVAWFNPTTLQGGFANLDPVTRNNPILKALPLLSGVRLTPVKTGSGTVLAAVYGTAQHGSRTCSFLPAVGVVTA